jgi:outer membrane protein assembly factor BamB
VLPPVVGSDGTVFASSGDNHVYAIDPSDGSMVWSSDIGSSVGAPAVGSDGTLYVPTSSNELKALDPSTGDELWHLVAGGGVEKPAVDGSGNIYVPSWDGNLYALDSSGAITWVFPAEVPVLTPAVGSGPNVYVPAVADNVLYAVSRADGTESWKYGVSHVMGVPHVATDGRVYVPEDAGRLGVPTCSAE